MNKRNNNEENRLPAGLAQPAQRALTAARITKTEQLEAWNEAELGKLHGMGPRAIQIMREALDAKGLSCKKD